MFGEEPPEIMDIKKAEKIYAPAKVTYTFNASSVPSKWLDDKSHSYEMPSFYTQDERYKAEIANLRYKAKALLDFPFSAGQAYNQFGTSKFPKETIVTCNLCGQKMIYTVDFFVHGVLDHRNTIQNIELVFERILDRIETTI